MPTIRPLWRALLTVFLTVMLVGVSVANAGHGHAGHAPIGPAASAHHDGVPEQVGDLSNHAERTGDDGAAGPCGCCCHQASIVRWDSPAVPVSWRLARTLVGIRAIAFDSVAPETLPEPPRTFA